MLQRDPFVSIKKVGIPTVSRQLRSTGVPGLVWLLHPRTWTLGLLQAFLILKNLACLSEIMPGAPVWDSQPFPQEDVQPHVLGECVEQSLWSSWLA